MTDCLSVNEIEDGLKELDGWEIKHGKLHKTFKFKNFIQAFGFMTQVAIIAEKQDHHPEWFNVYGEVVVDLVSHDVQGITRRDLRLARAMDFAGQSNCS